MPKKQKVSRARAVEQISAIFAGHLAELPPAERHARLAAFKNVIAKGGRANRATTSKRAHISASRASALTRA